MLEMSSVVSNPVVKDTASLMRRTRNNKETSRVFRDSFNKKELSGFYKSCEPRVMMRPTSGI